MRRINFLMFILLTSFVNQVLYAELIEELSVFSITLSNLAKQLKPGSGRPLPPPPDKKPTKPVTPPPLIPEKKPDEPSEPLPKFDKNKVYSFALGQDPSGSSVQIKIGLVDLGLVAADKGFDLVVRGPKFTKPTIPENFIVKKTQTVVTHGMPIETKVDKLSFPIDNAEGIVWSSDNKIIKPGPLGNFVLVKGTDYQMLKEEEKAVQENMAILSSIQKLSKSLDPAIGSVTVDVFNLWLGRFQQVTKLCQEVQDKKVESILKREMEKIVSLAQDRIEKIIKIIEASKNTVYNKVKTDILAEQQKIKNCSDRIKTYSAQLSLENVLYKFYEAFIKGEIDSPVKLSNWWVIRERKITKPITPVKPTGPTESLNLSQIGYKLRQEYFVEYKGKSSDKDREVFMATKTDYKDPQTGVFFSIKELLAYFINKADWEDRDEVLERWNQWVSANNYGKFWGA